MKDWMTNMKKSIENIKEQIELKQNLMKVQPLTTKQITEQAIPIIKTEKTTESTIMKEAVYL